MSTMGVPVRRTPLTAANPVTKLAATLVITFALLLSVDAVSASVALVLELLVLPWCGLGPRALARRAWPLLVAAVPVGAATLVFGVPSGAELARLGPLVVTEGSADLALAVVLRTLAVGLPSVVLLASTDPTDLADALAQRVHLPARFVLAALAGLRLVGLLVEEWEALSMARRARGLGGGASPLGRARVFAGQAFALVVLAVRRATRLAVAMEARGFGDDARRRTWARPSPFAPRDALVAAGALAIAVAAPAVAVATGAWSPVLG